MASSRPSYERNSNELFSSSDKRGKFGAPKLVVVGLLQLEIELVKNDDAFWNLKKESGLFMSFLKIIMLLVLDIYFYILKMSLFTHTL